MMAEQKILLCGIPSEGPILKVKSALVERGAHVVIFNQRRFASSAIEWKLYQGRPEGFLYFDNCSYRLQDIKSVYTRFMPEANLPEMENSSKSHQDHCRQLHKSLNEWLEVTDAKVVNKQSLMFSNNSKPYQAQLIKMYGLKIPPTIVTNNPESVSEFYKKHGSLIYKSISGIRSIVKEFDPSDLERLEKIKYCPVQFQKKLDGFDVRVHVIGRKAIATKIISTGVDYRYAVREGGNTQLEPYTLAKETEKACIRLSLALGLDFTGIDLRITDHGTYCFEVNPMPGYSYYEAHTGQDISGTLADYLMISNPL